LVSDIQGDQIERIVAHRASVSFRQFFYAEEGLFFGLLFAENVVYILSLAKMGCVTSGPNTGNIPVLRFDVENNQVVERQNVENT
jgi:hypothetical protein